MIRLVLILAVASTPAFAQDALYTLEELSRLAVSHNPRLARAGMEIDSARGRAIQARLYPNPVALAMGDELGDRTGPEGIWQFTLTQEIVTGKKLQLNQAAGFKEVDQAELALMNERYAMLASIRSAYFEVLYLQSKIKILGDLLRSTQVSVERTRKLLDAKQASRLDLVQLEVELEKVQAELEASQLEMPSTFAKLAAAVGQPRLPFKLVRGTLEWPMPPYDMQRTQDFVLSSHPTVQSARVGIEKAQILLKRAQVEPIPNISVESGYVYQGQNKSHDYRIGVMFPIPVWNRNQGNILSAQAAVGAAVQEVGRVENELADKLAVSFRTLASSQVRAERYRARVIPKARESYELALQALKAGQAELDETKLLLAQKDIVDAQLEYMRSLVEAWKAASEISGLTIEDHWPPSVVPLPEVAPMPQPATQPVIPEPKAKPDTLPPVKK